MTEDALLTIHSAISQTWQQTTLRLDGSLAAFPWGFEEEKLCFE